MADEKIRLVLSTSGGQDVKDLEKHFVDLAEALGVTDIEFEKVTEDADNAKKKVKELTDELTKVDDALDSVTKEANKAANDGLANVTDKAKKTKDALKETEDAAGNAAGSGGQGGRGILNLSWALQDLIQSGLPAVLNNVSGLASAFGLAAGTAGALALGALAVDQAVKILGPLLEDTEKPLKKFSETWKDFAQNVGADKQAIEEMDLALEKMAGLFTAGWTNSVSGVTKQFNEFLSLAREARQLQEEMDKEKSARKAGEATLDSLASDKDRGKAFDEYLQGQGEDGARGIQEKLAKDEREKARQEYIDEVIALKKAQGEFGTGRNYSDMKEGFMRMELDKNVKQDDPEVEKRAKDIAAGEMNKAARGDKKALEKVAGVDKGFTDYEREVEADKKAEQDNAKAKERRLERERLQKAEDAEAKRLASIGPPEELFRNAQAKAREDAERQRLKDAKEAEMAQKQQDIKNIALVKKAEAEEKRRVEIRDKAMERLGVTPEGLAVQRQNAAVGNSKSAQVARQNTAQQQEQALLQRFQNDGMTAEQAKKTTDEIGKIGKDIVQTMLRTGAMDLTMFKQLQMTAKGQELQRMKAMQEMRAGIRQPGFQGGNQAR